MVYLFPWYFLIFLNTKKEQKVIYEEHFIKIMKKQFSGTFSDTFLLNLFNNLQLIDKGFFNLKYNEKNSWN